MPTANEFLEDKEELDEQEIEAVYTASTKSAWDSYAHATIPVLETYNREVSIATRERDIALEAAKKVRHDALYAMKKSAKKIGLER